MIDYSKITQLNAVNAYASPFERSQTSLLDMDNVFNMAKVQGDLSYEIAHKVPKIADYMLGGLSWLIRAFNIDPDFSVSTADIGAKILMMDKDDKGIYHANREALQQLGGYNNFYDTIFDLGTNMDAGKFEFTAGNNEFVIWMWKGDYINLGAGAEIGIYNRPKGYEDEYGVDHWLVNRDFELPMTLRLYCDDNIVFNYRPEDTQWWITGFNPKFEGVMANELKVVASIDFSDHPGLWQGFYAEYNKQKNDKNKNWDIWYVDKNERTAYIVWQPWQQLKK